MAIDFGPIQKKYHGQWVALKSDQRTVVAAGKTAAEALGKAKKKLSDPILFRVPTRIIPYIGGFC